MFVRFRQTGRRLQVSLIETRRHDGKVKHEHVASLGAVPLDPTLADRTAFWTGLHPKLSRLGNRLDAAALGPVLAAIHARIPMPTQDDRQASQLDAVREDARQRQFLADATDDLLAGQREIVAIAQRKLAELEETAKARKAEAETAQARVAKAERGEDIGPFSRPLTAEEVLKAMGWTQADQRNADLLNKIEQLGLWELYIETITDPKRRRRSDHARTRAFLNDLMLR
jgi:hypothetical protein